MNDPAQIRGWLAERNDAIIADLGTLVAHESPSDQKDAVDALLAPLDRMLRDAGAREVTRHASQTHGDTAIATFGGRAGRPILFLCHRDTVFPIGTTRTRPFVVREGRAYGPGVFDMKGGLTVAIWALRAISELRLEMPRPVRVLINADEEIGSPSSASLIKSEAESAACALVLEPAKDGAVKTRRKGWGRYRIAVDGRAAHAGADPELGVSSVHEIAEQISEIVQLADDAAGTTINVGTVHGGTSGNVVAAAAVADIDCRFWTSLEAMRIDHDLRALRPRREGARITVDGGINRMPLERTDAVARLFSSAQVVGRALGIQVVETSTGGVSDGNIAAAAGTPTLDGLGAVGAGAHGVDEYVEVASLAERAALVAGLVLSL